MQSRANYEAPRHRRSASDGCRSSLLFHRNESDLRVPAVIEWVSAGKRGSDLESFRYCMVKLKANSVQSETITPRFRSGADTTIRLSNRDEDVATGSARSGANASYTPDAARAGTVSS